MITMEAKNQKKNVKDASKEKKSDDAHVRLYNKEYHEVKYHDIKCPICNSRIDEFGFCACGAGGS